LTILVGTWAAYCSQPTDCFSQEGKQDTVAELANLEAARLAVDFDAIDLKGRPFNGKVLKSKIVLLDFWAVWCKPCIAAFPTLRKLNKDFKDKNFEVVGVAVYSGGPEDVSKFLKKHEVDYKMVVGDDDLAIRFGVIGYPSYFLVGPDGKIHKKYVGEAKDLYSDVRKEILKFQPKKSE
jgi:thiol-disulfide isomerase/thioredoxin